MIDAMTLAEAGEIFAYWERDPPTHLIVQAVARLLGWTPRPMPPRSPRIEEIAASAPPGLTVAHGSAIGMPAPILDLETMRTRNLARVAEIARRGQCGGAQPLSRTPGSA